MAVEGKAPTLGRMAALAEVTGLYLAVLIPIRLLMMAKDAGMPEIFLILVPILFLYAPVYLLQYRGVDPWQYPLDRPAFNDWPPWREGLVLAGTVIGIIAVPFLIGYHYWQTQGLVMLQEAIGVRLYDVVPAFDASRWPAKPVQLMLYHLLFVAFPEEVFYRGYMQSRLDEAFGTPWRVLGASLGPGLLITCVLFAFGHTLVIFQWWHIFIIFPSLVFGWMRNRTGQLLASIFFHAWCNITVSWLDTLYGIAKIVP